MTTLAIAGGAKVREAPFPPWPSFAPDEVEAATNVLRSGKVNQWTGGEVTAFEREYAAAVGVKHAVAVANGTVSLELALRALGVGPGDEVIVPSRTFLATASAVVMVGARPVCTDVDRESGNVTAETIEAQLSPRTKAIIVVHLGGRPCEMDPILALSRENSFFVIEDCAQAHGATYRGRPVGSMGHIGSFSFCQDKIMTTGGEGGLVVTNDTALFETMWGFKDHGKSFDAVHRREHPPGFRWLHESFGTNWRMTEFQAAIGRIQLGKVDAWVEARRSHAQIIAKHLTGIPGVRIPPEPAHLRDAYYRFYVYLDRARLREGWSRDRVARAISAEGTPAFSGSCGEIYRENAFINAGFAPATPFVVAHELHESSLAFLTHPTMTPTDADQVGEAAAKVLGVALR